MGKFDALREAGFDAPNYDLETEDIIAKLEAWDARYGLDLAEIDGDSFTVSLARVPDDLAGFADEVADFCPDIVMQGVETVEALADAIAETRTIFFWWD